LVEPSRFFKQLRDNHRPEARVLASAPVVILNCVRVHRPSRANSARALPADADTGRSRERATERIIRTLNSRIPTFPSS